MRIWSILRILLKIDAGQWATKAVITIRKSQDSCTMSLLAYFLVPMLLGGVQGLTRLTDADPTTTTTTLATTTELTSTELPDTTTTLITTPATTTDTTTLDPSTDNPASSPTPTTDTTDTTLDPQPSTTTTTKACLCGQGEPRLSNLSKIVGGVSSRSHAWPWMAILVTGAGALCGGSLISSQYILTAAHCVVGLDTAQLGASIIILGRNRIITNTTNRAIHRITSVAVHPHYNATGPAPNDDIALIRLAAPVSFTDRVRPVCLGQEGAPFVGREAIVTGWGKVNESSSPSNNLREARVTVISNEECNASYPFIIRRTQVCASRPGHDACNGDSGGPLLVMRRDAGQDDNGTEEGEEGRFTQIGVVSFGRGCGQVGSPGVYTRVEKYLGWIRARTKGDKFCPDSFQ